MLDSATMKRAILVSILPYTALLVVVGQDAEAQNPTELRAPSGFSTNHLDEFNVHSSTPSISLHPCCEVTALLVLDRR